MIDWYVVMFLWVLLVLKHRWLITVVDWGYSQARVIDYPYRYLALLTHGVLEAVGTAVVFSIYPGEKILCLILMEFGIGAVTAELEARTPVWLMLGLHSALELAMFVFYGWAIYWVVLG